MPPEALTPTPYICEPVLKDYRAAMIAKRAPAIPPVVPITVAAPPVKRLVLVAVILGLVYVTVAFFDGTGDVTPVHEGATVTADEPIVPTDELRATAVVELPATAVDELPATAVDELPATAVDELPETAVDELPAGTEDVGCKTEDGLEAGEAVDEVEESVVGAAVGVAIAVVDGLLAPTDVTHAHTASADA